MFVVHAVLALAHLEGNLYYVSLVFVRFTGVGIVFVVLLRAVCLRLPRDDICSFLFLLGVGKYFLKVGG